MSEYKLRYRQAAIDFLSNISLDGIKNYTKDDLKEEEIDKNENMVGFPGYDSSSSGVDKSSRSADNLVPGRLNPRRMLETLNHRCRKRNTSSTSLSSLADDKDANLKQISTKQRLVVVSPSHRTSFSVYSILAFSRCVRFSRHENAASDKTEITRSRLISGNSNSTQENVTGFGLLQMPCEEDISYHHLLKPLIFHDSKINLLNIPHKPQPNVSPVKGPKTIEAKYDPSLLDDPEMITSRSKVVLNLPGYLTTIVNYVRPVEVKADINEQFRQRFPDITLTLSKLRSLKAVVLAVSTKFGIDLWTVANAFVYFETLVLKNLVTKGNRKLCCAASLVLSCKINDVKGTELSLILQELESAFKVHKKDVLQFELFVFVALEFGLLLHDHVVNVHHKRLVRSL